MSRPHRKQNIQRQKLFSPREREEELDILLSDDEQFNKTKQYLDSLILDVLSRFNLSDEKVAQLHQQLLDDVPVAARRFLDSEQSMSATYKFCTYFTWYIAERVNRIEGLQR